MRDGQSAAGEGEGVAADAAAQIGDRGQPGVGEAAGVVVGGTVAGGLFERFAGEVHLGGERAELGLGAAAEVAHVPGGGGLGGVGGAAEAGEGGEGVGAVVTKPVGLGEQGVSG